MEFVGKFMRKSAGSLKCATADSGGTVEFIRYSGNCGITGWGFLNRPHCVFYAVLICFFQNKFDDWNVISAQQANRKVHYSTSSIRTFDGELLQTLGHDVVLSVVSDRIIFLE